jgi:SRSO17 transposase
LLHFIGEGKWSDEKVLAKVREMVLPHVERHDAIEAWIIDDTGFPKQGQHSVGVARQFCGQLGKQDNCQVAVSLSLANRHASLPVAYQLYLPQDWAQDRERRRKVGIPELVEFKTKPEIALEQLREGYTIIANVGDQFSDIEGEHSGCRFKVPNPFYFIR